MTINYNSSDKNKHKDMYILFGCSIAFIIILLVIAIAIPEPTPSQYATFRTILALFSSGIAAMIPGILNVHLSLSMKNSIRAGGAIAVLVITYFYTPVGIVTGNLGDPREELTRMGVFWNGENFLDNIKVGDEKIVSLFLKGGIQPESAESDGRSLAVMLALNERNPEKILEILIKYHLDINYQFKQYSTSGDMKTTLLSSAIERGNNKLILSLLKNNVETNKPIQTFGPMGMAIKMFPLESAIYWKKSEIVFFLLDYKTDISVGDYAAYRQAYSMKNDYYWKEHSDKLNKILQLTSPPADKLKRVNSGLRIDVTQASTRINGCSELEKS
jgi:hypothetical protein